MIRAVLDTNVLLAALRSRNGASFEILSRFANDQFVMVIGNTVLSEYDEVLKRECTGLGIPLETVDRYLDAICARASFFQTTAFWKPALYPTLTTRLSPSLRLRRKWGIS